MSRAVVYFSDYAYIENKYAELDKYLKEEIYPNKLTEELTELRE